MVKAKIVDEHGRHKFTFHALRHYAASCWVTHNSTLGGIQQVSRWLGHANTSETLNTYAHAIHDPEAQARFLRMPNWLAREVALPAPQPVASLAAPAEIDGAFIAEIETPLRVPEDAAKWLKLVLVDLWRHGDLTAALRAQGKGRDSLRYELRRCDLPTAGELEAMARDALSGAPPAPVVVLEPECPIDLPDIAPSWLREFVRLLNIPMTGEAAARQVRHNPETVNAELRRLKIAPSIAELARRLRRKRVIKLHEARYQPAEIAHLAGVSRGLVYKLLAELNMSGPRGGRVGPAAQKRERRQEGQGDLFGIAVARAKTAGPNPLSDHGNQTAP